ncbi:MAG: dihydrofolate reductase family protein [Nocardioidaceae bacterium]
MIIVDEIVSADGYAARPGGSIDFFLDRRDVVETQTFPERMGSISDVLLGAATYGEMVDYWPGQPATAVINRLAKHVVSTSMTAAPWGDFAPAQVHTEGPEPAARAVSAAAEGDVIVWGSLALARALFTVHLVDEVWLRVVPVVLGDGVGPFPVQDRRLELLECVTRPTGFLAVRYRVR